MKKLAIAFALLLSTAAFAAQDVATGAKVTGVAAGKSGKALAKASFAVAKTVAKDVLVVVKYEVVGAAKGIRYVAGQAKRALKA